MKKKFMILVVIATGMLLLGITSLTAEKTTLIHNTFQEIVSKENKLHLKLIRTWGGEAEQDEKKFFVFPSNVAVDSQGWIYIADQFKFCVKVFEADGKYVRTIGRKGRGPGDLVGPGSIDFSTNGDLWVMERGNRRLQSFNASGKSKTIFKYNHSPIWMAVTQKNEIAIYSPFDTHESRKLIAFYNEKGERLRDIGTYHDPSKSPANCEWLTFAKDHHDNFLVGNHKTPIVRKYTLEGKLVTAFTFETPEKKRPEIKLNEEGSEIIRLDHLKNKTQVLKKGKGVIIKNKMKHKYNACIAIGTDSRENIYVVSQKKPPEGKEDGFGYIMLAGDFATIDRSSLNYDALEKVAGVRLSVFNPQGKVIAVAMLKTFCNNILIQGERIFIIDGAFGQRILEYQITINE